MGQVAAVEKPGLPESVGRDGLNSLLHRQRELSPYEYGLGSF
ncbi:MAG: hypothetical protein WCS17_01035 [Prevotella sp.]